MSENANLSQTWKTPNELLKLHRLKKKKDALVARVSNQNIEKNNKLTKEDILEAVVAQKRKNPFAKNKNETNKKPKHSNSSLDLITSEDTIFELLNSQNSEPNNIGNKNFNILQPQPFDITTFSNLFNETTESDSDDIEKSSDKLPIDWSLKLRMRILCESILPCGNLKSNQEASGITGFARCATRKNETQNSSLDISLGARFHQGLHYWQHPTLPWLTLFPRNARENNGFQINDKEREFLLKDWSESFRGVFQLLRARQCPFFYFCANGFTVLFRSAGIGGRAEMHAIMTPTTLGMRNALRAEEIEFLMPLKKEYNVTIKSNEENNKNSQDSTITNKVDPKNQDIKENESTDEEDMEEERWLESLGVEEKEIKKISSINTKRQFSQETSDDFRDNSTVLIEGVECQALFNFLLKSKSSVTNVGRLAGIPPTLLSPVAFPKASMQNVTVRSSKVRNDGKEYFSAEIKGIILPNLLPYMTFLLEEVKDSFSVTLAGNSDTFALTKVSKKLIEDDQEQIAKSGHVFEKENLSDCGVQEEIIDLMCNTRKDSVSLIERICFNRGDGFIWS